MALSKIVKSIHEDKYSEVGSRLQEHLKGVLETRLVEKKKQIVAEKYSDNDERIATVVREAIEALKEGRFHVVKTRIRRGKVERRKQVSDAEGYTFRKVGSSVKLVRMSPSERRKRKMGARRAKIKRRGKLSRIRQKYDRSMRRLKSLGG